MTKNSVGRPPKKDKDGNLIYRKICSVYLDIRLVEYIKNRSTNLSDWMEKAMRHAFKCEYCFYCFDDKVDENRIRWRCSNVNHQSMEGRGAPPTILKW